MHSLDTVWNLVIDILRDMGSEKKLPPRPETNGAGDSDGAVMDEICTGEFLGIDQSESCLRASMDVGVLK